MSNNDSLLVNNLWVLREIFFNINFLTKKNN